MEGTRSITLNKRGSGLLLGRIWGEQLLPKKIAWNCILTFPVAKRGCLKVGVGCFPHPFSYFSFESKYPNFATLKTRHLGAGMATIHGPWVGHPHPKACQGLERATPVCRSREGRAFRDPGGGAAPAAPAGQAGRPHKARPWLQNAGKENGQSRNWPSKRGDRRTDGRTLPVSPLRWKAGAWAIEAALSRRSLIH